ncbi:hypothetical protein [Leuconostoc pseudomesenteroides]|uniref:hypothetical protein n=1 Tax=Leuconostoc pseudomesenteroides TaxID=33968 RepID=UPI00111CD9C5|nr:hypothetical protein [Leuconostoc pseudomesenteroides]TOZ04885.1 hypothetical protein DIS14_07260 [Leuconostoc pseudomesenteroides]
MFNFLMLTAFLITLITSMISLVIYIFVQDKYLTFKILWESSTGWVPAKKVAKSELMYQIINDSLYKEVIKIDQNKINQVEREYEISPEAAKDLKDLSAQLNHSKNRTKPELISRPVINSYLIGVDNVMDNIISAVGVFSNQLMVDVYKLMEQRVKLSNTEVLKLKVIDAQISATLAEVFPKNPIMINILMDQIKKMSAGGFVNKDVDFSAIQLTHSIDPKKLLLNLVNMKYNNKGQSLGFTS